ncbi:MAG: (Na+)-NQR maturation NqrM [Pseudomonadota bacterium]
MSEFFLAFGLLVLIFLGMSLGVILMGKRIKGSCGGLNAISGSDRCVVCAKEIDPNSPLKERLQCPRARKIAEQMSAEQS